MIMTGRWMTAPNLRRARRLWDAALTTSEIARQIGHGCTKDCIVGYAHRQNWAPRPSPIGRRKGEPIEAVARLPDKPHRRGGELTRTPPGEAKPAAMKRSPREIVERVACRPQVLASPTRSFRGCQWPVTDGRPWRFCDAPVVGGGAWCPEHRARVYGRSPRQEFAEQQACAA